MTNAIRCCISCILPCGALDVIRIVHSNGKVEEIAGRNHVRAADIIQAYPNHVLKKPNSSPSDDISSGGAQPKILIVPPAAQLQRGKIYFLIPVPEKTAARRTTARRKKKKEIMMSQSNSTTTTTAGSCDQDMISTADRYLTDITSEKISVKRRGRAGVWRPRLESITETATELCSNA